VELLDEDFPDAMAGLPADTRPVVLSAAAGALPADWGIPDFTADFFIATEDDALPPAWLADGFGGAALPAVAFVPVGAFAPVDFVDLPAPLPRAVAFFPALVADVAGLCRDFSLAGVRTVSRALAPLAVLFAVLPAAVVVFLAVGVLAPVVFPAAFRGLVVAMRVSRRSPLRCMLQRRLR
jgi:hypothetical protein